MEKLEGINISSKSLKWHKKIGEGRDAIIYDAPNGMAYKIYKDPNHDNYKCALEKIQKNNYNIKLSNLPLGAIYIDGEFRGAIIKRIHGFQLHKVFGFLSRKSQITILKQILAATKELTDNYIYPVDLANTPFLPGKSSNILLDYKKYPNLIDIDGSGAYYANYINLSYQEAVDMALNILFLDLILGFPVLNEPQYEDIEYLNRKLNKLGFDGYLSKRLSKYEANYELIDKAIDTFAKTKIL